MNESTIATFSFQNQLILSLDFLLTLTSFSDGQGWLIKQSELIEKLVELATVSGDRPKSKYVPSLKIKKH